MKKYSYLFLALMVLALTACSSDDQQPNIPNESELEEQPNAPIVVTVDNDGKADAGHTFSIIDETNFYIDDIKYTTTAPGELTVTGYHKSFFFPAFFAVSGIIPIFAAESFKYRKSINHLKT